MKMAGQNRQADKTRQSAGFRTYTSKTATKWSSIWPRTPKCERYRKILRSVKAHQCSSLCMCAEAHTNEKTHPATARWRILGQERCDIGTTKIQLDPRAACPSHVGPERRAWCLEGHNTFAAQPQPALTRSWTLHHLNIVTKALLGAASSGLGLLQVASQRSHRNIATPHSLL